MLIARNMAQHPTPVRILVATPSSQTFQEIRDAWLSEPIEFSHSPDLENDLRRLDPSTFSCVLIDLSLEPVRHLAAISFVRSNFPRLQVIAFAESWHVAHVVQAIKLGAIEVIEFPSDRDSLLRAIQQALCTDQQDMRRLDELIPKAILEKLSSDEVRILRLLIQGRTAKEVGATLDVSVRTIHYRKKSLLRKLGVENRSEAIELIRLASGTLIPI